MSLNKVLINTNQVAEFPEISYIDNPAFVFVKTDSENKILYGVKQDGEFFFGAGCPHQVRDYVEQKLAELSLDEYEDIVAFLNDYLGSDTTLKVMIDSINAQIATKVDKLHAVCMKCGCEDATRTQRLIDGKPADKNSPLIMIGGDETYEARCIKCYELPDVETEKKKKGFRLLSFEK